MINYPIGVHNEGMRRDAFRTWIISRKLADEKEKDKKNLFVCNYNPTTQEVKYVKNICLSVETKVETLGLLEHINLGTVQVIRTARLLEHLKLRMFPGDRGVYQQCAAWHRGRTRI